MEQNGLCTQNVATPPYCAPQTSQHAERNVVPQAASAPAGKGKYRAMLWGTGGTVLSAVGFIALALFEQYNGMLSELRSDLKHFNETSSEYVKKESVQKYREEMRECLKEQQTSNAARSQLEQELRASERAREQMGRELQRMSERLAFLEGRQSASPPPYPIATGEK
jgi:hypothetical protein